MKTIASSVETYIKAKPFLLSALSKGIINLSSLARIMSDDIQADLQKEVQDSAIVMALKRLGHNMEFQISHKIVKILRNISQISVRSQIIDYTFVISDTILDRQAELINKSTELKDAFYTSSRGIQEINIVISNHLENTIDKIFKNEKLLNKIPELAAVCVKLPKENITIPGVYYFIFQRLAWEGIIINEVISTFNEFSIIVDEKQSDKAFRVINNLKSL